MTKFQIKCSCLKCKQETTTGQLTRCHKTECPTHKNVKRGRVGHPVGIPAWNKGLTKEISPIILAQSIKQSIRQKEEYATGKRLPLIQSEKSRQNTSERMSLHNPGGKSKWFQVSGKRVQGTYEKRFAECCEAENIHWEKVKTNNHIFKYYREGKVKSYAPDFYLPQFILYVEIKGFWWGDDEVKMKLVKQQHYDKNVVIIYGKERLDYICEDIKNRLPLEPVWSW